MRHRLLCELALAPGSHPLAHPHVSAASGLARVGRRLYFAADDEHHLGLLDLDDLQAPVVLLRVEPGDLPADFAARKRHKRDFEALCVLPSHAGHPHGALLVVGSGSRARREHLLRVPLDQQGLVAGPVQARSSTAWLAQLRGRFADLNIEGAFVDGAFLCLLQRGNVADPRSACVWFALDAFLHWLDEPGTAAPQVVRTHEYLLPAAGGVPLAFTDGAAAAEGGWWFTAVAEQTRDSYADGECVASAVGRVDGQGVLQGVAFLDGAPKVEGLAVDGERLLLVTDADDPAQPSRLLQAALPALG